MDLKKIILAYGSIIVITILGLYLIKEFNISYPINISSTNKSSELAVVGEGKIEVVPDTANVEAGITVNNAQTVEAAQSSINETNNKIINALEKLGIDKKDIKTSNYSINPNYTFDRGTNSLSGYNGNTTLTVTIRKLEMVSQVVQEVTKAGANEIYNTRFVVENPEKYREEARNQAIQNAREQAQKLANSLGIKLGKIVNIVESSPNNSYPITLKSATQGLGGANTAPNIEPGSQTINSTVTLYFEKL